MRKVFVFCLVLMAALLVIPASAADHTIQFQNHCSYEVAVVISGGPLYTINGDTYGACQCLKDNTCNPTTRCPAAKCSGGACDKGTLVVDGGGFKLDADGTPQGVTSHTSTLVTGWQGGFWARSNCHDGDNGYVCDISDQTCLVDGKGAVQCGGAGITTATKSEIRMDAPDGYGKYDAYDLSAVDGWSIPTTMEVVKGTGDPSNLLPAQYACTVAGTAKDLASTGVIAQWNALGNTLDPNKVLLKNAQGTPITVQSACAYASALNQQKNGMIDPLDYLTNITCCKGPYGSIGQYRDHITPYLCDPATWPDDIQTAHYFKNYLPNSYSYAYDDKTASFMCRDKAEAKGIVTQYIVTFCPANEGTRIYLPGSDEHTHVPAYNPGPVVTPVPTKTPVPAQTPVPATRYNPATAGGANF